MSNRAPLGEVIDLFDSKRVPLNSRQRAERQGPYPYYGAQGIIDHIDGYIFDGRYLLVPEDGENLNSRKLPIAFFATGRFWVNNHAHVLRGKAGLLDTDYLCYWLNNADISGLVTGAAQPKLSQANLCRCEIELPALDVQIAIAGILRAYDKLIENNTRRIAILEEMARRMFEEWFVHFRAPGCEGLPLVDSAIGSVPKGWDVNRLDEVATIVMGQSPSSDFYNTEGRGLPFHQGVTDFGDFFPSNRVYCTQQARLAQPDDLLISVRAPVGRINIALDRMVIGRGLSAVRSARSTSTLLLLQLRNIFRIQDQMGHGTIFKAIGKDDLRSIKVVSPPDKLARVFEAAAKPLWGLLKNLTLQNRNLHAQRDLLLPKLISGEIDVSAAAAPLPEAAE